MRKRKTHDLTIRIKAKTPYDGFIGAVTLLNMFYSKPLLGYSLPGHESRDKFSFEPPDIDLKTSEEKTTLEGRLMLSGIDEIAAIVTLTHIKGKNVQNYRVTFKSSNKLYDLSKEMTDFQKFYKEQKHMED